MTRALAELALVGTSRLADRAMTALAAGELPVDELLAAAGEISLERRVLLAAAMNSVYSRAGRLPVPDATPIAPAPAEDRPACSSSVAGLLGELLAIRPRHLLLEALQRLDHSGAVVAPALLPELLDTRDDLLADVLPRVIGARGRWLAALGDGDQWLADGTAEEASRVWQEGPHARRIAALVARRRVAPAEAREWVAESWTTESAEHRAQLLAAFADELEPADIPFIEQALTDRSAGVRAEAARLLSRLPESEAARRSVERADVLLAYDPPKAAGGIGALLKKAIGIESVGTLVVTPPERFDPAWERDGLSAKAPKGVGERAHWLTQSLALVSPEHWEQRFRASPRELVRAAMATEWMIPVLHGWSLAAMTASSASWATLLWDAWREMSPSEAATKHDLGARSAMLLRLYRLLPRGDAEARALELMTRTPIQLPFGLNVVADIVPAPWSVAHARRFLAELAVQLESAAAVEHWNSGTWFESLGHVATSLPPETFADAFAVERRVAAIDTLPAPYRRRLEEFRDTIRLRQRIHEEIRLEPARR